MKTKPKFGDWCDHGTADRSNVILGFFDLIGWHPCAWSDVDERWKIAKCTSSFPLANAPDEELRNHAEPHWREVEDHHEEMCWWMPMPPSSKPENPATQHGDDT